jgi:hypothetical protein
MHVQKNSVFLRSTKTQKKRRLDVLLKSKAGVQLYYLFKGLSILPKLNYLLYKVQYFLKVQYARMLLNYLFCGTQCFQEICKDSTEYLFSRTRNSICYARMQLNYLFSKTQ